MTTHTASARTALSRGVALCMASAVASSIAGGCTLLSMPPVERVVVRNAWARSADSGATGGAYFDVVNNDSVALTLIGLNSVEATASEVHETMQHEGMAHMMPREQIAIAPGSTLSMTPGGVHVMLIGLRRALVPGDSVRVQLRFADSSTVLAVAPVRAP